MSFFASKKSDWQKRDPNSRFRDRFFQARVRQARDFRRSPRIFPSPKGGRVFGRAAGFWKLLSYLALVFLTVAGYFLCFSSYFLVREVAVSGTEQIKPEIISDWMKEAEKTRIWGLIPQNSWPLLNRNQVEKIILPHSSRILKVVDSRRFWPNGLEIVLEDRQPEVIWQSNGEFYFLSSDGVPFEQVPPDYATSTPTYVKLHDITEKPAQIGENLGVTAALNYLEAVRREWPNFISSPIQEFKIPGRASPDIFLTAAAGWTVYFDLKSDPLKRLANLRAILTREIPADREKNLSYIDLRLPSIAYYCYKDEPCASLETKENPP